MPSIQQTLDTAFRQAIQAALGLDADPVLVPSQNEKFGDYQANAAMALVKPVSEKTGQKANPRQIAEQIKAAVTPLLAGVATEVTIAGPGFINVRLSPTFLSARLQQQAASPELGIEPAATKQTVVVDYSAPNVAKEMHVGHLRSTVIGDAIVRVLSALGHNVVRQNHIGDWGTQFGMLIAHLVSMGQAGEGQLKDLEGFYREAKKRFDAEPAFTAEARQRVVNLQAGAAEETAIWQRIVNATREYIQSIYDRLGVLLTPADEAGESKYNHLLADVVKDLKAAGIAELSDGATVVRVPPFEAPLMIQKTDGGYGYGTTDLAAVRHRTGTLGAGRIVYVVGSPQSEHLTKVFYTARKAGWDKGAALEHAAFGSVLGEDGKIFRTRAGGTVKLAELLGEAEERALTLVQSKSDKLPADEQQRIARSVGVGAVKYADLSKDRIGDYTFSFDQMISLDGNTAPYLQYAYARIKSIFRKAAEDGVNYDGAAAQVKAEAAQELALAKHLLRFGDVVASVARDLKPHILCGYLYELATKLSAFYENCPVLYIAKDTPAPEPTRTHRLALCDATAKVLAKGLDLLGIDHPERM